MVNFGSLAAEMVSLVWGTPTNFNGFRVLAAYTARYSSRGRQPNFAALNRGRHLYSAGQPSLWALAHILVADCCCMLARLPAIDIRILYSLFSTVKRITLFPLQTIHEMSL